MIWTYSKNFGWVLYKEGRQGAHLLLFVGLEGHVMLSANFFFSTKNKHDCILESN